MRCTFPIILFTFLCTYPMYFCIQMLLGMEVHSLTWYSSSRRLLFGKCKQEIVLNVLANSVNCFEVFITVVPGRTFLNTIFLMVPLIPFRGNVPWWFSKECYMILTPFKIFVSMQNACRDCNCLVHQLLSNWERTHFIKKSTPDTEVILHVLLAWGCCNVHKRQDQ